MPKMCQRLPVLHLTISKEELNSRDPLYISQKTMEALYRTRKKRFSTCKIKETSKQHISSLNRTPRPLIQKPKKRPATCTIKDTPKQLISPLSCTPRPLLFNCMVKEAPEMYDCPSCGIKVYLKVNLQVHFELMHKSHTGVTVDTFCQLSDTKYNMSNILKQYTCKNCDFGTYSLLVFLKHVVHHPKNAPKTTTAPSVWKCNYNKCFFETRHESQLSDHVYSKHLKRFECEQGSAKTGDKTRLCGPPKCFACRLCPFKTAYKRPLEEIFRCRHCSYKAKRKHHLELHMVAKHTPPGEVKWFECEQCPYKAKSRSTLNGHVVARHTAFENIIWFVCEQCGFKCKRKSHLKQHMLKHSEDKPLMCEVCSYQFKRLNNLKKHMKKVHKVV